MTRAMKGGYASRAAFTTEGVLIGSNDFGPLAGARAVSLNNPEAFVNQARFAMPAQASGNAALQHLLRVENGVDRRRRACAPSATTSRPSFRWVRSAMRCGQRRRSWRRSAAGVVCR